VRPARRAVLADGWYSWVSPPGHEPPWDTFTTVLGRLPAPLTRRLLVHGGLRGAGLALLSTRYHAVAVNRYDPGWRSLLLLRALFGRRRKLVVLQFFDHPVPRTFGALLARTVERWALRRTLARAQVLTTAELEVYPQRLGLSPERFTLIRFAARTAAEGVAAPLPPLSGPVLAAGRAHCDWETLFAAAGSRGWDLQVVCSAEDHAAVERLNREHRAGAQIDVELSQPATQALLRRAAISVICVSQGLLGRGHIRLAEATDTGAAIVASDVASLAGYVEDGTSAVLVPPGDPGALRAAVEALMRDPDRRARLTAGAYQRAAGWTGEHYLAALGALAAEAAAATRASDRAG
jgi:hypothetical protein